MAGRQSVYAMKAGDAGIIREINADGIIRQRLFDMGMLPNVQVKKERCAVGGDPVWVKVGNVQIALRKVEAESVMIENM